MQNYLFHSKLPLNRVFRPVNYGTWYLRVISACHKKLVAKLLEEQSFKLDCSIEWSRSNLQVAVQLGYHISGRVYIPVHVRSLGPKSAGSTWCTAILL